MQETLKTLSFDYILVCGNEETVLKDLKDMGITKECIIDFRLLYYPALFEKVRLLRQIERNMQEAHYRIFVTGLSYAYHGTELSSYRLAAVNCAGISQSLDLDYLLAKRLLDIRGNTFKYAVIGVAPYSFHSRMSVSAESYRMLAYILALRDTLEYHVPMKTLKDILQPDFLSVSGRWKQRGEEPLDLNDPIGVRTQCDFVMGPNQRFTARGRAESWNFKRFPRTVEANVELFKQYLALCHGHQVKPIVTVFPASDIYRTFIPRSLLKEFYSMIGMIKEEVDFSFLDFFADHSFTHEDFYDIDHLNKNGARKVSDKIDEYIEGK